MVGKDELAFHHDVEVARVMIDAMSSLHFLPPFRLQVNNRKLIQGFYQGIGLTDIDEAMRIIDKLDKLPAQEVARLLVERGRRHCRSRRKRACVWPRSPPRTPRSWSRSGRSASTAHSWTRASPSWPE